MKPYKNYFYNCKSPERFLSVQGFLMNLYAKLHSKDNAAARRRIHRRIIDA
jgi:hypothetical protein